MPIKDADIPEVLIYAKDDAGLALFGSSKGTPTTAASEFAVGAMMVDVTNGLMYLNTGTSAAPVWEDVTNVSTANIAANAVTQPKMEEGSMVFVDKQLTNAEVLAFRATPIELIAAPGANKSIVVHKFAIVSDDTAGAWTESTDNLVIEYADGVDISAAIEAGTLVGGAVQIQVQGVLDTVLDPDVNAAVELFNTGDGEWGGGNAANTMSVRIWYSVIDTVAFS